jgi:guanylate kinase
MKKPPKLYVISAPSGAGKSTLIKAVLRDPRVKGLVYAVSHTSRVPRPGETNGKDYFFVSPREFQAMIDRDDFLEWTVTFGNYYGTSEKHIKEKLASGESVITDVDVVGAKNIKKRLPESVLVFIAPPTFAILEKRLTLRHTESNDALAERLDLARNEIGEIGLYDFLIINDELDAALDALVGIINKGTGPKAPPKEKLWADFFS